MFVRERPWNATCTCACHGHVHAHVRGAGSIEALWAAGVVRGRLRRCGLLGAFGRRAHPVRLGTHQVRGAPPSYSAVLGLG